MAGTRYKRTEMGKKIADAGIMFCATALAVYAAVWQTAAWRWLLFAAMMAIAIAALNDWIDQQKPQGKEPKYGARAGEDEEIRELILLYENEKPVKAWDLAGKVSLLIGRDNPEEPVDVDLGECEYAALIDERHAVLNYCMDAWYVEDLNSKNGIRIKKVDDGICYKVMKSRPCRLLPGDMILIANTKLLIT